MQATGLKQGFIQLIYFTWLHNADAIAFFVGAILVTMLLFVKLKRSYVLYLIAFVVLLIRFEYLKHIVGPLSEQTVNVVIQQQGESEARHSFNLFFYHLIPTAMYFVGWGSLFLGMISASIGEKAKKND